MRLGTKTWVWDNVIIEGNGSNGSYQASTKIFVLEAVRVIREIEKTLTIILTRMQELAKELIEYPVVRAMSGVGDKLAPRLIAEIGDVRRFHSAKVLIAFAGIDAPPYQCDFSTKNTHGCSLGLSIVDMFAKRLNGSLTIFSKVSEIGGSTPLNYRKCGQGGE